MLKSVFHTYSYLRKAGLSCEQMKSILQIEKHKLNEINFKKNEREREREREEQMKSILQIEKHILNEINILKKNETEKKKKKRETMNYIP